MKKDEIKLIILKWLKDGKKGPKPSKKNTNSEKNHEFGNALFELINDNLIIAPRCSFGGQTGKKSCNEGLEEAEITMNGIEYLNNSY